MRTFIAIDIPDEIKEYLLEIQKGFSGFGKMSLAKDFHLTLKFLGEVKESHMEIIIKNLKKVTFKHFSIRLDKLGVFPGKSYIRVFWIGVCPGEDVASLQKSIESVLDFPKDKRFHPHITLARVKFLKDKEGFVDIMGKTPVEPKEFKVKAFKLKKSELTEKGPVYSDLEVFDAE